MVRHLPDPTTRQTPWRGTEKKTVPPLLVCRGKINGSKKTPTYPWNIPQTLNQLCMKEILSYWYFGVPGVCSKGQLVIFLEKTVGLLETIFPTKAHQNHNPHINPKPLIWIFESSMDYPYTWTCLFDAW